MWSLPWKSGFSRIRVQKMPFKKETADASKVDGHQWSSTLLLTVATLLQGAVSVAAGNAVAQEGSVMGGAEFSVEKKSAGYALANKQHLLSQMLLRLENRAKEQGFEGQRDLHKIRDLRVRATIAMEDGQTEFADQLLSEAIVIVTRVLRSAPREAGNGSFLQQRYKELAENVTAFRTSLLSTAKERELSVSDIELERIDKLIHSAASAAGDDRYGEANRLLTSAYQLAVAAITRIRSNETIYHKLEFDSPEEQYRYEQQRYISHELLVQMMRSEIELTPEQGSRMQELVAAATSLHERSREHWQRKEKQQAIEAEVAATRELVEALQVVGLTVPF